MKDKTTFPTEKTDCCKDCIRQQKPQFSVCRICGQKKVKNWLDGPCLFIECMHCGDSCIGASFFAPCETDDTSYTLLIRNKHLSNKQILFLRKLLGLSALSIKFCTEHEQPFEKGFYLNQIMEIRQALEIQNHPYVVIPEPYYGKYFTCEKKIIADHFP
ncbi:MAG: hypothetical protein IJP31_01320 [Lachnospiraceae bacterium]|nr:hypothetical protein [Lachnospiraceae bacterium]